MIIIERYCKVGEAKVDGIEGVHWNFCKAF